MTVRWHLETVARGGDAEPDGMVRSDGDVPAGSRTAHSEPATPCLSCHLHGRPRHEGLGGGLQEGPPDAVVTRPVSPVSFAVTDAVHLGTVSVAIDSHAWTVLSCDECEFVHHPTLRLLMVIDGRVQLQIGDHHYTLGPNGGLMISGTTPYSYQALDKTTYLRVDLDADVPALRDIPAEPCVWPDGSLVIAATSSFLVQATRSVHEPSRFASREPFVVLEQITVALLHAMVLHGRPARESDRQQARRRVIEYISSNSADPCLRPESIARAMGTSTRTLQRLFKGDLSVADHIRSARLENALRLLKDHQSPLTLAVIAQRCGFPSIAALRRAVYSATGVLPSEYRSM